MGYKYKKYIEENEEIRCGFKVSSNRKKVWNIQLGLLEEVKRICKKHGLRYYADSGTLLGAVRHKGFIPRDDDTDIVMFREDYDKFMKIAPKELPSHYRLESDCCSGFAKLRNECTAAIDYRGKDFLGGISLDIFPLDYMSKYKIINIIQKYTLLFIRGVLVSLRSHQDIENANIRKKYLGYVCRFLFKYFEYKKLYQIYDYICKNTVFIDKARVVDRWGSFNLYYDTKDFDEFDEVNFENIKICIPFGYNNILKTLYGDYKNPVIYLGGHNCLYSVEKSYIEIVKNGPIDKQHLFNL